MARLWLVLRQLAPDGKCHHAALESRWLELGFSPVYLRQLLHQGEGVWWKQGHTQDGVRCVFPIGARRVCEHYDVPAGTRWLDVPAGLVGAPLKDLRAWLYTAGLFARERPVTLSRAQISEHTGLTKPTQRKAEARCGVRVQQNVMPTPYHTYHEMPGGMLGEHWVHPQAAGWFYCPETGTLAKRLPSTYSLPSVEPQTRRTTPKRALSGLIPYYSHDQVGTRRRWFYSVREYVKTRGAQRAAVCYLRHKSAGQYTLWEPLAQGPRDAIFSLS